jgi:PAS domain S-box-containing protein
MGTTELKKAVEELQVWEHLHLITDSVPVNLAYMDRELRFRFVNRSFEERYAMPRKRIIGMHVREVVGNEFFDLVQHHIVAGLAGTEVNFTVEVPESSSSPGYLQITYHPHFDDKDEVIGIFTQSVDITERVEAVEALRASEEKYRTVFETTGTATVIIEEDKTLSLVNEEFVNLSGYCREEIEGKKSLTDFVADHCREQMMMYHKARRMDDVTVPPNYEFDFVDRFGIVRNILTNVKMIHGTGRSVMSYQDTTAQKRVQRLQDGEKRIMELIAGEATLSEILELICHTTEGQTDGGLCSIHLADPDGTTLRHGAAPSLPDEYNRTIDGTRIGPDIGSCGTAAHDRGLVIVSDIATDNRWAKYQNLPLSHGLRACWSMPIIASTGELLGTFALYYRCIRQPCEAELQQIERSTYLTSIAIERARGRESLEANLHFLKVLIDTIPNPVFYKNAAGEYLGCNRSFLNAFGLSEAEVIGKSFFDLARQELAELFAENDRTLFATAGIHVFESSVMFADGNMHEVIFSKATFGHQGGRPEGIVGVMVDITEVRQSQKALSESEERVRHKLDSILSPDGDIGNLDLADIIDAPAIQSLMEDFYELAHIPVGIMDLQGKVLVGVGWQDICTKFHRVHPETLVNCIESDLRLSDDVTQGEFRLYKCKNNMWDMVTPIVVGGQYVGNLFLGQYFLEGESPDQEFFRVQARRYGFSEEEYIAALDRVPRMTRDSLDATMIYFLKFVEMLSKMSYSNLKLARSLAEGEALVESVAESEERFRGIFEQNEDAMILLKSKNFDLIDANPAAELLFGYAFNDLKHLGVLAFIAPEEYDSFIAAIPKPGESSVFHIDRLRYTTKSGEAIIVSIWGNVISLRSEEVIICSFRNISTRILMEEEARNTQARLIHANKMTSLGILVSGIAHEINNPNTFIQGNASILEKVWRDVMPILTRHSETSQDVTFAGLPFEEIEQVVPRLLLALKEGSRRISAIVGNLKDFAREDKTASFNAFDVNKIIRDGALILSSLINRHTDNFMLKLDENLPPAIGKALQVEQVVINLITNGLQALPNKKAGLTVATWVDLESNTIVITVRDEGEGMTAEVLTRITEPFFSTKLEKGGTGLGLSICSSIIKEHNGSLQFESAPGVGTTATLTLAMAQRVA